MGIGLAAINIGAAPNDGTGDPARDAFDKVNDNALIIEDNLPLMNFSAVSDPTVNDDSDDDYSVGSRWINTTTGKLFECVDATVGAAVWNEIDNTKFVGQNLQSGTTYTGVLADAGKVIECSNASPFTFTIPANASVAYPVDTKLLIVQGGAGSVTIAITSDTLNGETLIDDQYGAILLWKKSATVWVGFSFQRKSALINEQTGTTYTIQASDNGKLVLCDNASDIAVTLPDTLKLNFHCTIIQIGAGVPTITPDSTSVTINGVSAGVEPTDQWKGLYLAQYAADEYLAIL